MKFKNRYSIIKGDPGFTNWCKLGDRNRYQAYLNGIPVDLVFTLDEDQGFLIKHKRDNNGRFVFNREGDGIEKEILYGKVELIRNLREKAIPFDPDMRRGRAWRSV